MTVFIICFEVGIQQKNMLVNQLTKYRRENLFTFLKIDTMNIQYVHFSV